MAYGLQPDELCTPEEAWVEPLYASIRVAENGFIVATSGGTSLTKTYIANTLEHAQSLIADHINTGA
ncbi:MAG: hypothetical protein HC888_05320 [Candidatus Competibacteraceae bacterium]|nr:hypothetical protein [Candidatus Competibacteraceae bacterium]NJM09570.1 hypothetical protein [Pseudobdellovibrionaceae bacterium]